jgi:hypothetical protein
MYICIYVYVVSYIVSYTLKKYKDLTLKDLNKYVFCSFLGRSFDSVLNELKN